MTAAELRIGNYVKTTEFSSEHFEVRAVSKDRVLPLTIVDKDGYSVDWALSETLPIPLTEDWLLKFGFVVKDKWFYKTPFVFGYLTSDNVLQFQIKFAGGEQWTVSEIQYVHQLQNLYFALTGTDIYLY